MVNKYLQSWDVPNVFVMGACVFHPNMGYNPTSWWGPWRTAAQAIRGSTLKNPGPLVRHKDRQ